MADEMPRADEVTNLTPEEVATGLREVRGRSAHRNRHTRAEDLDFDVTDGADAGVAHRGVELEGTDLCSGAGEGAVGEQ